MTDKPTAPAQSDAPSAVPESFASWYERTQKIPAADIGAFSAEHIWRSAEAYAALRTAQRDKELSEVTAEFQEASLGRDRWMAKVAQLERERDAEKVVMTAYMKGILKALGLPENEPVNLIWAAQEVVKRAETTESSLAKALDEAKSWKRSFEQYRNAWIRELGGWLVPKSHEIDSLVLTMRKRVVNPLLGNCSVPHWLGEPTSDKKALQQTPHPRENGCREWKADDSEPNPRAEAAESALSEAAKFKAYVHKRLDDADVPTDPEPEQNKEHGCRIEGRLNHVLAALSEARQVIQLLAIDLEKESCKAYVAEHGGDHEPNLSDVKIKRIVERYFRLTSSASAKGE